MGGNGCVDEVKREHVADHVMRGETGAERVMKRGGAHRIRNGLAITGEHHLNENQSPENHRLARNEEVKIRAIGKSYPHQKWM